MSEEKTSAFDRQVGGNHYQGLSITPIEYCHKNKLGPCEFSVVRYVTRYKSKGGIEDLQKAIHYLELLIEMEYGENKIGRTFPASPGGGGG